MIFSGPNTYFFIAHFLFLIEEVTEAQKTWQLLMTVMRLEIELNANFFLLFEMVHVK